MRAVQSDLGISISDRLCILPLFDVGQFYISKYILEIFPRSQLSYMGRVILDSFCLVL